MTLNFHDRNEKEIPRAELELDNELDTMNITENPNLEKLPSSLPSGLKILFCVQNPNLEELPVLLPTGLQLFICNFCNVKSLPRLDRLEKLTLLTCSHNKIVNLSNLPNRLHSLSCFDNKLKSLPPLPNTLAHLRCENNQITSLPPLPERLDTLICGNNQLESLPTLPVTLKVLSCENNQLKSLPELPNSLSELYCENNPITDFSNMFDEKLVHLEKLSLSLDQLEEIYVEVEELLMQNQDLSLLLWDSKKPFFKFEPTKTGHDPTVTLTHKLAYERFKSLMKNYSDRIDLTPEIEETLKTVGAYKDFKTLSSKKQGKKKGTKPSKKQKETLSALPFDVRQHIMEFAFDKPKTKKGGRRKKTKRVTKKKWNKNIHL